MSLHQPARLNSLPSSLAANKPSHSELHLKKWDTVSHAPLSQLTTSLSKDSHFQPCNQKPPNPWTCNGTGSNARLHKTNFNTNGNKVLTTMQTITANTTKDHIIKKYDINTSKTSYLQIFLNEILPNQSHHHTSCAPFYIFLSHTSQTH